MGIETTQIGIAQIGTTRRVVMRAAGGVAAVVGLLSLVRCGAGQSAPAADAPRPSGQAVTLRYLARGSQANLDIQRNGVAAFEQANPKIKIQFDVATNYFEKLRTELASGDTSDVAFTAQGGAQALANDGGLMAMDPFIARDVKPGDYYDYALESGRHKGKSYVFPYDGGTFALAYNKQLFDNAQLPYPDDTWTWEKYAQVAARLTVDRNGKRADDSGFDPRQIAQYGSTSIRGDYWYYIWANGGDILTKDKQKSTLDSREALDTIQWLADLHTKRVIMPSPKFPEADPAAVAGDVGFTAGRVALSPHGRWRVSEYRRLAQFAWDVAPMPKGKAGRAAYGWFSGMSIISGSKAAAEAWEFCKFWGSEPGQRLVTERGQAVPAMPKLATGPLFLTSSPPTNNKAYLEAIKDARQPPAAYILDGAAYGEILNPVLNAIWAGEQVAHVGIPPLVSQLNSVLARGRT